MAAGRILVVDDERFFQELLRDLLQAGGHRVGTVSSGEDALKTLASDHFDVLLTDVVMPGLDGIGLVREAKRRDPDLEAVAITGHEDVRLAVQAMKAGCSEFLTKPVQRDELVQVCDRALSRARLRREHSQLLDENVDLARSQALYRQGLQLLATLDGERLQDLSLSVLARVTDAQAAALWIADEKGILQLRGYRGVVDRAALPARIDPRDPAWSGRFAEAGPSPAPGARDAAEAFLLPLVADDEPIGLALLSDGARGPFAAEQHAAAAAVADFTAIAARNARRFHALERIGLRDRDTGAYNLAYFIDYAGKEFYKARRYGRSFSLAVVALDDADRMRKEGGRDLYRRAMRDLVAAISRAARDSDILAKVSEAEYYVLLPETDHFGALMFLRRAREEVRREASIADLERRCPVLLSMGAASFPKDGEDFDELLHWARARVDEQRGSLLRRLHPSDLPPQGFWELADLLLSGSAPPGASPSAWLPPDAELFAAVQREAAREIARDPRARGLLYVGAGERAGTEHVVAALPAGDAASRVGDATAHVYVLGPRASLGAPASHPLVTQVYLDGDQRFAGHELLLFLSEHSAYAFLGGPARAFHTCDAPLVDALVAKLQALYDLQPL